MKNQSGLNYNTLNLNLLRVFDALYKERNATLAGDQLGLTQSAVSHALGQLRELFRDELFVRGAGGMVPTTRAIELGAQIHHALLGLKTAVSPQSFTPAETTRKFTLACSDYTGTVFVPKLAKRFYMEAPNAQLKILPLGTDIVQGLDEGKIDLVVNAFGKTPDRMSHDVLWEDRTVWVMRKGHPCENRRLTLSRIAELDHVVIDLAFVDDGEDFDGFVRRHGLTQWNNHAGLETQRTRYLDRHSGRTTTVPNYLSAIALVSETDMITELPRRFAVATADRFGLVFKDFPMTHREGKTTALWHQIYGNLSTVAWFRQICRDVAATL